MPGSGKRRTSRKAAGVAVQAKPAASTACAKAVPLALLEPIADPGAPSLLSQLSYTCSSLEGWRSPHSHTKLCRTTQHSTCKT